MTDKITVTPGSGHTHLDVFLAAYSEIPDQTVLVKGIDAEDDLLSFGDLRNVLAELQARHQPAPDAEPGASDGPCAVCGIPNRNHQIHYAPFSPEHHQYQPPSPASDDVEKVARAMQTVSRPDADPDKLTPGSRGAVGVRPVWQLYEHMARAAIAAMQGDARHD